MKAGDLAPDFEAVDANGDPFTLSDALQTGPVVLFFYPGAFTPGCTKETCHFRDVDGEFRSAGATPIGISADKVEKQARFATTYNVEFPLLSDESGTVAKAFGVRRMGFLPNSRTTFVIDTDRRVLEVVRSEVNMEKHADLALEALKKR